MEKLMVENLAGGRALETLNEALDRIVEDCKRRPRLEKARTISLTVAVVPVEETSKGFIEIMPEINWAVAEKIPPILGVPMIGQFKADRDGVEQLMVNPKLPTNRPNQSTIPAFGDNEEEGEE